MQIKIFSLPSLCISFPLPSQQKKKKIHNQNAQWIHFFSRGYSLKLQAKICLMYSTNWKYISVEVKFGLKLKSINEEKLKTFLQFMEVSNTLYNQYQKGIQKYTQDMRMSMFWVVTQVITEFVVVAAASVVAVVGKVHWLIRTCRGNSNINFVFIWWFVCLFVCTSLLLDTHTTVYIWKLCILHFKWYGFGF